MIEKLKKAEVPERFLDKISVSAKRVITDNQNIILDFLENHKDLSITYSDKKLGAGRATEVAISIFKLIFSNEIPIKVRIVYQFTPILITQIIEKQPLTNIKNADIIIFDGFDIIDAYNSKVLAPLIGYRKNNWLKSIYVSNEELQKIAEKNVVLQGLLSNYLEIKF